MEKIRKNFGFGCMRLPMIGEDVDMEQTKQMVDCFLEQGFNYFDTAHGYLQGKSELALKECLTSRYPREDYVLTDKLSGSYFKKEEDIRPFFESQLAACGVDYFDFYLMHSQSTTNYQHFRDCRAYETAFALKAEGKVRHVGISFHDRAAVLEQILTDYPAIEVVQIQFIIWTMTTWPSRAASAMRSAAGMASPCWSWSRSRAAALSTCPTTQKPCWTPCTAAAPPAMPSGLPRASPVC